MRRLFIIFAVAVLASILLAALFPRAKRPNVILITIDALRADHLGCYGYQRSTSPNIDKLARKGTLFLNCFSTAPVTVYSFAALLTGRYLAIEDDNKFFYNILDKKFTTLAEYLKNAGYFTAAFVSNDILKSGKGFEQGFDYYSSRCINGCDAQEMTSKASDFLNNYRIDKPLFVWLHYIDPHVPYTFRKEQFKIFGNDELYRKNDKIIKLLPKSYAIPYWNKGYIPRSAFHQNKYNLNYYIACYDGDILHADFHIGKLLSQLNDDTIIILTADHGESLGEHDYYFGHRVIYDEGLHIPLIIKANGIFDRGKRISRNISAIDIVPTILDLLSPVRYSLDKNRFDGESLKRIVIGKDKRRKYIYSYSERGWGIRDVREKVKLILNKDGEEELYFLPDEYNNRINDDSGESVRLKEKLRKELKKWLSRRPVSADINVRRTPISSEDRASLSNLGYLQ